LAQKETTKGCGAPVPVELVERRIYSIRGQKVMLSPDLADLYDVETRVLVQAMKRNIERFPNDFMFQLSVEEHADLKSQIVISSWGGSRRGRPYAFSELGVAMLSSVLKSRRAIQMNIVIMRAFVRMRELLSSHKALAEKVEKLEVTQKQHGSILVAVVQDIQRLKNPPVTRAIGFRLPSTRK